LCDDNLSFLVFDKLVFPFQVSQEKVEKYANEIVARGMDRSIMEIDDRWQRKYGDFDFDPDKFPDPKVRFVSLDETEANWSGSFEAKEKMLHLNVYHEFLTILCLFFHANLVCC
jgi:alpha-glucosidase (family GH31 glycosyl hydrolase)